MDSNETVRALFADSPEQFEALRVDLAPLLRELDRRLAEAAGLEPLAELCAELFRAGGKRLRPLAALVSARAFELPVEPSLVLALVSEWTHGAALLHDDVIDEADTRRAQATARRRWNNTLSILGGDHLLVRSLQAMNQLGCQAATDLYLRMLQELVSSEAQQHSERREGRLDVDGYRRIALGKTGSLFGFACAAPALVAGDASAALALESYGRSMGLAFQMIDDLKDLLALDSGKPAALDLADGVASLPLRLAAQHDPVVKRFLQEAQIQQPEACALQQALVHTLRGDAISATVALSMATIDAAEHDLNQLHRATDVAPHYAVLNWLRQELHLAKKEHQRHVDNATHPHAAL